MLSFFHVSAEELTPGQVLAPGRFGDLYRLKCTPGYTLNSTEFYELFWEMVLETARVAAAGDAPSRLACVFGTHTIECARQFRDRFRQGKPIYEISCKDQTPTHDGNFDMITDPVRGRPFLNYMPTDALGYWRNSPKGIIEVIIGGPVTVVRQVE